MCGLAGIFGGADRDVVARMLHTLRHRGPDDEHMVAGDEYALGVRRLSIVDVEGGRQPLTNEDGTIIAAQNGELYNFPELRPALLERGHALRTRTDTEVLPHLWEEHGVALPEHVHGMFALAVWDDRRRIGLLARDRMGKKPLYYWRHRGALYFASELKALLAVPGFERRIDFEALHHYLSYKHVPHPFTIFAGVRMLPPAHRLVFAPGSDPVISRYWSLSFAPGDAAEPDEQEAVDELLARMRTAVKRRLMSDVPVGFFLSGGIDSSLTTALAAEVAPDRVQTFTLTYDGGATTGGKEEDRRWARWVAERFGTAHHEETVTVADYPARLRAILQAFDEPFAGVVSTYFLAQRMARHVKVAVAGDGADELFGSYLPHRLAFPIAALDEFMRTGDRDLLRPFEDRPGYVGAMAEPCDWAWRAKLMVLDEEEKRWLYAPEARPLFAKFDTREHLHAAFEGLSARDPLNRVLEAEWRGIFPDQVLTFVDRLSMAHSLEVRSAFLDTDVVEYVARLPGAMKIRGGETKYLLKQAARRYFPDEMVRRPKEGFIMPIAQWVTGDLLPWVRDTLAPERLATHGLFDSARVRDLIDRLAAPDADHRDVNRTMALVVFQEWHELYM